MSPERAVIQEKPLLIIQLGRPPEDLVVTHGEQSDWMKQAIGGDTSMSVIRPHAGDSIPNPSEVAGAVLTGSWSMVTDREPWSELTAEWIRCAMQERLPLLGICYGHQLMADALGGKVGFHASGREIGQHEVRLDPKAFSDALFASFPQKFQANLTHEQTVLKTPPGATVLASSAHDAHQIIRYSPEAISVQFHPEFNIDLMTACLVRRQDVFAREGYDIPEMVSSLRSTEYARAVLNDFAKNLRAGSLLGQPG
ncbi:glutamine amidotransferase [Pseudomonas syringae]|nr:glutamine amidotransferase [Pseudomonas syringae]MBI6750928.1 glutamine amidotransferase [Pseudomonas syringae]MBI6769255.1 glutamine amidotransferase [Pseudomonas syringae]MBI6778574.1 glutamine amidotransferase [Pseudomonas syringae]MBI6793747.1 glutamine amidotransferase [Pseudomonas syringae]MBI6804478.1 glutamine amidotransferase [Pseudomonas syringae]